MQRQEKPSTLNDDNTNLSRTCLKRQHTRGMENRKSHHTTKTDPCKAHIERTVYSTPHEIPPLAVQMDP